MFEPGQRYNRREDIHTLYGGQCQGGIATPKDSPYLFLFTRNVGKRLEGIDGFVDDNTFAFVGEGQIGDMIMRGGNLAILEHQKRRKKVLLFEHCYKAQYKFVGIFSYTKHSQEKLPDVSGKLRNSIVFYLDRIQGIEDESEESSFVALLRRNFSDELVKRIAQNPKYLDHIEWRELEYVLQLTLEELGFHSEITSSGKDGGKDIILKCTLDENECTYFVEIKHWRSRQRVGSNHLKNFLEVIVEEKVDGGLFLSSSGFCEKSIGLLTEIERNYMRLGGKDKIYSLCKRYSKSKLGILSPSDGVIDVLYENTI